IPGAPFTGVTLVYKYASAFLLEVVTAAVTSVIITGKLLLFVKLKVVRPVPLFSKKFPGANVVSIVNCACRFKTGKNMPMNNNIKTLVFNHRALIFKNFVVFFI